MQDPVNNRSDSEKNSNRKRMIKEREIEEFEKEGRFYERVDRSEFSLWFKMDKSRFIPHKVNDNMEIENEVGLSNLIESMSLGFNTKLNMTIIRRKEKEMMRLEIFLHLIDENEQSYDNRLFIDVNLKIHDKDEKALFYKKTIELADNEKSKMLKINKLKPWDEDFNFVVEVLAEDCSFVKKKGLANGIVNMGVTCYMNSYLQSIFHIKKFRYYINQLQPNEKSKFVFYLQSLFYLMENGDISVNTLDLQRAFGWNIEAMFTQQDVNEFSLKLLDAIEQVSKLQGIQEIITKELFKGKIESYIKCVNVDYESKRNEDFFELQMEIKDALNVEDSLEILLKAEDLSGANAYQTEDHGKQDAQKGIHIIDAPDMLVLNLNRTAYNLQTYEPYKILKRYEFSEKLDMSKYCQNGGMYELYAVFTHIGYNTLKGHYLVYLKINNQWMEFNDEVVSEVSWDDVKKGSYGGKPLTTVFCTNTYSLIRRRKDARGHAYMLMYVRKDKKEETLNNNSVVKKYLSDVVAYSDDKLRRLKKQKLKTTHKKLHIVFEDTFIGKQTAAGELFCKRFHHDEEVFKIFQQSHCDKEWVVNNIKPAELKEQFNKKYGLENDSFKLYVFKSKFGLFKEMDTESESTHFKRYSSKEYVFLYKIKEEEKIIEDPVLVILKRYQEEQNCFINHMICLKDVDTKINELKKELEGDFSNEFSLYYESNENKYNLHQFEDTEIPLYSLIKRSRSKDVICFVIAENNNTEKVLECWDQFRRNGLVNLRYGDHEQRIIFDMYKPATEMHEYLVKRNIVEKEGKYLYAYNVHDTKQYCKSGNLNTIKIGNLIAESNDVALLIDNNHTETRLLFDVNFFDNKNKEMLRLNRDELEDDESIIVQKEYMEKQLERNEELRKTWTNNYQFFKFRTRNYPLVDFDYFVQTPSDDNFIWDKESLDSREVDSITIIPVVLFSMKYAEPQEMNIGKENKEIKQLFIHFTFDVAGHSLSVHFKVKSDMKVSELRDELEWFIVRCGYNIGQKDIEKNKLKEEIESYMSLNYFVDDNRLIQLKDSDRMKVEEIVEDDTLSVVGNLIQDIEDSSEDDEMSEQEEQIRSYRLEDDDSID